jgi:hypothetical protein
MYNKDQQDALFTFSFIPINNIYMFRAGLLLIITQYCIYSNWCTIYQVLYIQYLLTMSSKPARNM